MVKTETLSIPSPSGLRLSGMLHHPAGRSTGTGVVVAHGMLSSKVSDKHRLICERAAALGFAAIRFDFRGRGESEGDPSLLTVSNETEDLRAVLTDMHHRGVERMMVVGSSLGGSVAILDATTVRGLAGLVTIAAPARLPKSPRPAWGGSGKMNTEALIEIAPGEFISSEFFRDARRHDIEAAARAVDCPWLIIHGRADSVVSVEDALFLSRASPTAELVLHPTADHRFDQPDDRTWLIDRVVRFISAHR